MKIRIAVVLIFGVLHSTIGQQEAAREKRILVFTRNGSGYVHENIFAASQCLRRICEANNLQVDITDDPNTFTPERLAAYSAVIFANTNNEALITDEQRLAFRRYMESGGRFMGIHSALGTERQWKWFKDMLGGTFDGHPPCQEVRILIADNNHPSTKGLPAIWTKRDECYLLKEVRPGSKVLLNHDLSAIKDVGTAGDKLAIVGTIYPATWTDRYDGGLTWITTLGHESGDYDDPVFVRHIQNGLLFLISEKLPIAEPYAVEKDDPMRTH